MVYFNSQLCMMPHQTDRLSYKSPPIVRSTLILHYAVALLLLTHSNEGNVHINMVMKGHYFGIEMEYSALPACTKYGRQTIRITSQLNVVQNCQ